MLDPILLGRTNPLRLGGDAKFRREGNPTLPETLYTPVLRRNGNAAIAVRRAIWSDVAVQRGARPGLSQKGLDCAGWCALEHDITNIFQSRQPSRRLHAEGSTQADLIPREKSKVHGQGTCDEKARLGWSEMTAEAIQTAPVQTLRKVDPIVGTCQTKCYMDRRRRGYGSVILFVHPTSLSIGLGKDWQLFNQDAPCISAARGTLFTRYM
ncbi:hypothetical protein CSIM01_02211 [Colletotrichum simmondsii]|uniref:Uncharacterized protein n=1 Tax=Colletotrichum simmondsii TaxID=703756 RepID=A0A135RZP5_9PEZI|nr:hypothetical protein CSIM01_02211 [Colletotrichum simmondsii]